MSTYLFTPKITTSSIHTVAPVALLVYYHISTLLPHDSLQIIPSIHIIHFLQQHFGFANYCTRNLHLIRSPSARQPPPRLVSPTYHSYVTLHRKSSNWKINAPTLSKILRYFSHFPKNTYFCQTTKK